MKVEELAYKLSEIKKINLSNTSKSKVTFSSEIGYIKNENPNVVLMSVADPDHFESDDRWGVEATDCYLQLQPQEVVGPIFLGTLYFRGGLPGNYITVITSEARG